MTRLHPSAALLCLALGACARSDTATPRADSPAPATATTPDGTPYAYQRIPLDTSHPPGTIIDSVFPMPEMIRRFRSGLPEVRTLAGGEPSQRALVTKFVAALAARDKATLGQLALSRAEFAWIYYPNTADAARENGLPPSLRWNGILLNSEKGIARALDRLGGAALTLDAFACPAAPVKSGAMTLHDGCLLRLRRADGSAFDGPLFGSIIEHAGRFKFVSYANDM